MKLFRNLWVFVWALACFTGIGFAQTNTIDVTVYNVDTSKHPTGTAVFSVFERANGRYLRPSDVTISATHGGQPVRISQTTERSPLDPVNIALVIDLTASQTNSAFIDQQKQTAETLLGNFNPQDSVAVITFDGREAKVGAPLRADANAALNFIAPLQVNRNASGNLFYDAVSLAIQELQNAVGRKYVIILTDVIDPKGTKTEAELIADANAVQAPLFIIGFNEAKDDVLLPLSNGTRGFYYVQRTFSQQGGLTGIAERIRNAIFTEVEITFQSPISADDSEQAFVITAALSGGVSGVSRSFPTVATRRAIGVTFPRLEGIGPKADQVRFEPEIRYLDTGETPQLSSVTYVVESGLQGENVLRPGDSADPNYTWNISGIAGGDYVVRVDVEDSVGNKSSGRITINVASPLTISFINPAPDSTQPDEIPSLEPAAFNVELAIEGSFGVNEVILSLDGKEIGRASQPPYIFEVDARQLNAAVYRLRADATDNRGNKAQDEQTFRIKLVAVEEQNLLLFVAIGVVAFVLLLLLLLIILMRRRNRSGEDLNPQPSVPESRYLLRVLAGVADNNIAEYPLSAQEGSVYSVGRSRSQAVRVIGDSTSREHGRLFFSGGQFFYEHVFPSNPSPDVVNGRVSLVNGRELRGYGRVPLNPNGTLAIGETQFLLLHQ